MPEPGAGPRAAPPGRGVAWWGLGAALTLGIVWVAVQQGATDLATPMGKAVQGGFLAALATALGALPAVLIRRISPRSEDVMLGFGAGVMAAASSFSLIIPGVEAAEGMLGHRALGAGWVSFGLALGALALLFANRLIPHDHVAVGHHGPDVAGLRKVWLMVFALALHNFPEGMAIGVAFSGNDNAVGMPLTAAIAVQDVPEGLVVAVALRAAAVSPFRAAWVAALTGLAEPIGAVVGSLLTTGFALLYPLGLGFAAGAMIWVVSHEIIPETHRKGHEQFASLGLMGGFIVMMLLDTALA